METVYAIESMPDDTPFRKSFKYQYRWTVYLQAYAQVHNMPRPTHLDMPPDVAAYVVNFYKLHPEWLWRYP